MPQNAAPWWATSTARAVANFGPVVAGFFVLLVVLSAGGRYLITTFHDDHLRLSGKIDDLEDTINRYNDDARYFNQLQVKVLQQICINTSGTKDGQVNCLLGRSASNPESPAPSEVSGADFSPLPKTP